MPRVTFNMHTGLPPEQVLAMLTDFSARRLELWPTLARELYEVYEVGATSADVKEGSPWPSRMWERVHYNWSVPGRVRWTVQESNYFAPGSYVEVTVQKAPTRGQPGARGVEPDGEWAKRQGSHRAGRLHRRHHHSA